MAESALLSSPLSALLATPSSFPHPHQTQPTIKLNLDDHNSSTQFVPSARQRTRTDPPSLHPRRGSAPPRVSAPRVAADMEVVQPNTPGTRGGPDPLPVTPDSRCQGAKHRQTCPSNSALPSGHSAQRFLWFSMRSVRNSAWCVCVCVCVCVCASVCVRVCQVCVHAWCVCVCV